MISLKQTAPRALADIIRHAPLSPGKVDCAWLIAVGPAVQRQTAIRLDAGLLLVDAMGRAWADEVRRSARVILARMQALLGDGTVSRLEVRER
jgi:hypothetical protein